MLTEFHIGIDDTDSESGGCTTYTAAVLFDQLSKRGIQPSDYPWLVRLNPNIPWKTRGNGALSIHLLVNETEIETIQHLACEVLNRTADQSAKRTDPAVVFLKGPVPEALKEFSKSALHEVLPIRRARTLAKKIGAEARLLKGTRGLIGSLAAIGAELDTNSHTFEIIAYRTGDNIGTPRRVNPESIRAMNSKHAAVTFHNLDPESGRILICPHGPDPVLLGIRGVTAHDVENAFKDVRIDEPIERIMIFRTNQGTDAHLTKKRSINDLAQHQSAILEGRVETFPKVLRGGHVVFQLRDDTGIVDCAAFAPTRSLTKAARDLLPGDRVRVYGGIRKGRTQKMTLNLEKMKVLDLVDKVENQNPLCPSCSGRCESMGRGQGFRCKKCSLRIGDGVLIKISVSRIIRPMTYSAAVSARRHLTSPVPND